MRDTGVPASATIDPSTLPSLQGINSALGGWKEAAHPWYSDQILPFDVTLSGATENGAGCAMKIFGVEILNEGYGTSIDDAVAEMQGTFVARGCRLIASRIVAPPSATRCTHTPLLSPLTRGLHPAAWDKRG